MTQYAIHITGASGSGVSTLGRALAEATGAVQLDTDDYYWAPVEPKFSVRRDIDERLRLLRAEMDAAGPRGWILSGSIGEWGAPLVPSFQLVVFVETPTVVRIERLKARESERFGAEAIAPGGHRHETHSSFIQWAADYETGTKEGRNRAMHEAFLARLACPALRLDGALATNALVARVKAAL